MQYIILIVYESLSTILLQSKEKLAHNKMAINNFNKGVLKAPVMAIIAAQFESLKLDAGIASLFSVFDCPAFGLASCANGAVNLAQSPF
jgi:hypothetical protein